MRSVDAAHVSWGTTVKHAKKIGLGAIAVGALFLSQPALADEGGVSFWVPGFFGSLAATPQTPGFSYASIFYHASVDAGADVAFARQVTRGRLTANFDASLNISLAARADLYLAVPSYVFEQRLFGAQASVAVAIPFG